MRARTVALERQLAKSENRASSLDRFKPYPHQRCNEGVRNADPPHRELATLGRRGNSVLGSVAAGH